MNRKGNDVEECRVDLRHNYRLLWESYTALAVNSTNSLAKERTPDDTARLQSCIFAFITAMDKMTLLARTLLQDEWLQVLSWNSVYWLPAHVCIFGW